MIFSDYIQQAWGRHGDDPAAVLASFEEGLGLVGAASDIIGLSGLVVHVAGEHLGRYNDGARLLDRLGAHPAGDAESGRAVARGQATLALAAGDPAGAARWEDAARGGDLPAASDGARIRAAAAAVLAGQGRLDEAARLFDEAVGLAAYGPGPADPAARALAVTANNLAASLEERPDRDAGADALMVRAAREARRFWEIAGTWQHVERAEYRLSRSLLAAGQPIEAERHARICLEICAREGAGPEERFFGYEALALALGASRRSREAGEARREMEGLLEQVPDDWREYCREALEKVPGPPGA